MIRWRGVTLLSPSAASLAAPATFSPPASAWLPEMEMMDLEMLIKRIVVVLWLVVKHVVEQIEEVVVEMDDLVDWL